MKILCVCRGGNCRSHAAAYLLKYAYNQDAIAVGFEKAAPETLQMLCTWADMIFVMTTEASGRIPEEFADKVRDCDVGPDVWWKDPPDSLLRKCDAYINQHFDALHANP